MNTATDFKFASKRSNSVRTLVNTYRIDRDIAHTLVIERDGGFGFYMHRSKKTICRKPTTARMCSLPW